MKPIELNLYSAEDFLMNRCFVTEDEWEDILDYAYDMLDEYTSAYQMHKYDNSGNTLYDIFNMYYENVKEIFMPYPDSPNFRTDFEKYNIINQYEIVPAQLIWSYIMEKYEYVFYNEETLNLITKKLISLWPSICGLNYKY